MFLFMFIATAFTNPRLSHEIKSYKFDMSSSLTKSYEQRPMDQLGMIQPVGNDVTVRSIYRSRFPCLSLE